MSDPAAHPAQTEYASRLARNLHASEAAAARTRTISNLRLVCFLLAAGLLAAVVLWGWSAHALWLPLAAFIWLVTLHARASQRELHAQRAARLYEDGLARLDGTWPGRGRDGAAYRPEHHLYAEDLDLFGRGSLFELLCVARSAVGERRLADWLLEPAAPDEVRARQPAVAELRDRLDFREELALVEGEIRTALEHSAASTWGSEPARLHARIPPWLHAVAGTVSAVFLVGWLAQGWNPLYMLAAMTVQFALAFPYRLVVQQVLDDADRPAHDLALMGRLLESLERATFQAPHLNALQERLQADGDAPSVRIGRLVRLTDFAEARMNQIFLPISWLFSIGTQLAFAIETWRKQNGAHLGVWSDVLADFEALASLAGYAYEHAGDPFPDIVAEGPLLEGVDLRHPLLAPGVAVPNDATLASGTQGTPQAYVVSGSNMSGKSTFLRTIGVNAVLAFAGGVVPARSLRISPLAVCASIQIHDSLQEGSSKFYAEIERLKAIVDTSEGDTPVLFLLDEILHGTNSHDRRIGADAVIRTLLANGSVGLVTTHDLALAEIAESSAGQLRNVHFEDHMEDGRMAFDYRLRGGVVQHSNALALMRAVGLEVSDPE